MLSSLRFLGAFLIGMTLLAGKRTSDAANVQWTSPTDGLWQTAANWSSSPATPGATDVVTIDQPGALTVTLSSGSQSIAQLTMQENLLIASAAELAVGAGGGSINGALTITNGRLTSQAGGILTVNGATSPSVAALRSLSGGTLNLPTLAAISAPSNLPAAYDAQGASSKLDLSTVTTFTGGNSTSPTSITASNGGRVELENVAALTSGATLVLADGANSVVDLSALTHISSDNQFIRARLDALNGGTLLTPNLATIGRATVEVRGSSSLNLQSLTNADGASFTARVGGVIAPPLVTSYAAGLGFTEFWANGVGSLIDLSEATTFSGATFSSMVITANDNGKIDLSGVETISHGAVNLVAGVGGFIDLSSLQSYAATNLAQVRRFRAENGGTVRLRAGGKTLITNAAVELAGSTSVITGQELELGTGASLAVNGALSAALTNTAGVVNVGGTPGTTTIGGAFQQGDAGVTRFQLGGLTAGTQFDQLVVNGAAQLSGTIHVSLINGFTPAAGNTFKVLTATGGVTGQFNVTWSGAIPWDAQYDGTSVTLVPGFDADFDLDGAVDAEDLALWETGFGMPTGAGVGNGDANADGDVDGNDFLQWQRELGATLPTIIAVPEPSAIASASVCLVMAVVAVRPASGGSAHRFRLKGLRAPMVVAHPSRRPAITRATHRLE